MSLFNRTLDNTKRLTADNIHSDVYSGVVINNIEDYLLGTSNNNLNLGASLSSTINDLNQYSVNTSTSFSNTYITENSLQNQINSLVIAGVSSGNLDLLYGISIVNLDAFKGLIGVLRHTRLKVGEQIGITNNSFNNYFINVGCHIQTLLNDGVTINSNLDTLI